MSDTLTDLRGRLSELRAKADQVFQEAGDDLDFKNVTCIDGDAAAKAAQLRAWNDEMTDVQGQINEKEDLQSIKTRVDGLAELRPHPGHPVAPTKSTLPAERPKSLGELFLESDAYKHRGTESMLNIETKTLMETAGGAVTYTGATAGWYPMDFRAPNFVDAVATRAPMDVINLIPKSTTTAAAITYIAENAVTNAATEVTEGSAKPEAALSVATVTEAVRKIAVWIPVTDEQLADVPQVRSYIERRLTWMVRDRLNTQVLSGNGTAPNLSGITDRSITAAQAKGTDPVPDAIHKEIVKIQTTDYSYPNAIVMHPNDWQDVRLLRTSDGIYIWGSPADAGPERMWGLDVVVTPNMTENTALIGDFRQCELAMREGVNVKVTDSHSTYFTSNITVILVELRAAFLVYRPGAFGTVTGI